MKKHMTLFAQGLIESPMYTGVIEGMGPRYCPSIEDKIMRFADKNSHQIFVEPEGLTTHEFYPNGISTSLPFDTQDRICAFYSQVLKMRISHGQVMRLNMIFLIRVI